MKKLLVILMVLVLACGILFAEGAKEQKVKIGALMRNRNEQFLKDYCDNLEKLAKEKGVDLNVQDAREDAATQLDQLSTLLTQGYKYFVIIPQDTAVTAQMAQKINEVKGGAAFSNIQPSVEALKVSKNFFLASSPEVVGGQYQAVIIDEYFKKYPEKAPGKTLNMLLLNGQLGHPAQVNRKAGLLDKLAELGWKVNIVAEDTANWRPDEAQQKMDSWIAAFGGKFNVVAAQNDDMALGAVEALKTAGYVKKDANDGTILTVPVIGVDATATALASMSKDEMYATVLQDSVGQSTTAFDLAYIMATKGSAIGATAGGVQATKTVIAEAPANDPAVIAQCFLVPFKPVTKANYKQFMK